MRRSKDTTGLSVTLAATMSPQDVAHRFNQCFGVVTLHVGRIRDVGLDVIQDSVTHATIEGLPAYGDERAEAERLAGMLAKQSRVVLLPEE